MQNTLRFSFGLAKALEPKPDSFYSRRQCCAAVLEMCRYSVADLLAVAYLAYCLQSVSLPACMCREILRISWFLCKWVQLALLILAGQGTHKTSLKQHCPQLACPTWSVAYIVFVLAHVVPHVLCCHVQLCVQQLVQFDVTCCCCWRGCTSLSYVCADADSRIAFSIGLLSAY